VFTKGCPLRCKWCQNPESQKSRAEVAFYVEKCTNCNRCVDVCQNNAINPITKISDYSKCVACGKCVEVCENEARKLGLRRVFTLTYQEKFFAGLGYRTIDKGELPHKVWGECLNCVKFPDCDEIAMIKELSY